MIVSSWGTRYSNSIVDSGRNTIISSKNVSITNASLYNVVIGVDGLTLSAKNNTASPMTYMGKITVGRGTSGALTTTGATHVLGYNSTTGEVSRVGLAGTSIVGTPTYTITSNHPYPLSTTATYSVILAGFATGTLAGSYLVSIGEAMYQYQASGSATLNVLIGNSNKTGVKTAIGTGHVSQRNVLIGNSHQTIINTTSGNTNKQTDNFFMGRNNKIQITGISTSAHSYSNIVSGYGVTVTQQGGVRFNKNYINGYTGGLNLTSSFGVDDSFMFGIQATHTLSKGGIYDATIIANNLLGLTGSIYDSALISNKSLTVNGVWNSAVIGNETCTLSHVTASTASVDNSLIAATKTFSNGGYLISNSAVIGVEGLTLTAALARTVVLPKLRIGIGTGATLPTTGATRLLGTNDSTGEVIEMPLGANFGTEAIKTLATGVAAAGTDRNLVIAAQTGTADDMIELTGLTVGDKVLLRADAGDTITIKHNDSGATIKILLKDDRDYILDEQHALELILVATNELAESKALTREAIKVPLGEIGVDHVVVTNKVGFHMDFAFYCDLITLEFDPIASNAGPTGAAFQVDVNVGTTAGASMTTMLSTKLTVDAGEYHSSTAATPAVISVPAIAQYAFVSIDVDVIGSTLAGRAGFVTFNGWRT
jgi:hypothetical protein